MFRLILLGWLALTALVAIVALARWLLGRGAQREKIIERQTVVVRCSYCGTLNPVDAGACEGCGATSR